MDTLNPRLLSALNYTKKVAVSSQPAPAPRRAPGKKSQSVANAQHHDELTFDDDVPMDQEDESLRETALSDSFNSPLSIFTDLVSGTVQAGMLSHIPIPLLTKGLHCHYSSNQDAATSSRLYNDACDCEYRLGFDSSINQ
jgi:hypothetical protein